MSKGAIEFSSDDEYYTPKEVAKYFLKQIDYDPATTKEKALEFGCKNYDTIETDGLTSDWTKHRTIWCNPPFTIKHLFLQKAVETYKQNTDICIYLLVPIAFLTTKRFHDITKDVGVKIYLPDGRIKFESGLGKESSAPAFGSVVITLQDKDEIAKIKLDDIFKTTYAKRLF